MSEQVVGAPVVFAARAEVVGRATGSLRYLQAGAFVDPTSIFIAALFSIKQKDMKKRELREGSRVFFPLACAASYVSFQRASQALPP